MRMRKIIDDEKYEENSQVPTDEEPRVSRKPKTGKNKKGKIVKSRYVRVYRGPSTSYPVVATMSIGDRASILDRISGYYKIRKEDLVGYVSSNYFEEE